jgi:hypothetical protein
VVTQRAPSERSAVAAIERHGVLLVYPLANRAEPASLWSVLYPGVRMRWAWDEGADDRVVHLWHLRERLAHERQVVYGKWYKGRAVFFSRELFAAMLAVQRKRTLALSREARELYALLEEDSPQSTKRLRREAGLAGKQGERVWTRAMRELWELLLVVGVGEVDDGAFPSLAVGATRWLFEELWEQAAQDLTAKQKSVVAEKLSKDSAFGKHWHRTLRV